MNKYLRLYLNYYLQIPERNLKQNVLKMINFSHSETREAILEF